MEEGEEPAGGAADYVGQSCDWYDIPCHATSFAEWAFGILLFLPRWVFEQLTNMTVLAVESIPVPAEVSQGFGGFFASAGPGAIWVADLFALKEGAALVFTAYAARFVLRALPAVF